MLTGKSPRVINISAVPGELQSVLGKALEESKEERYQSALEMKEAVQQALTAGPDTTRDLGQGECPQCGKLNPTDVKFCTECTAAVEVMCLSCDQPMQIWNKACGQCGTLQLPLIEEKTASLQQAHDLADEHLADYRFDEAIGSAQTLEVLPDPRFQRFIDWKEEFISRVEEHRASQYLRVTEIIRDALSHEEAYDYDAAVKTLEAIPESLFQI